MNRGVIFFNAGPKHGTHLAVAVASLREHYSGPIALITEQQGAGRRDCELVAADKRLAPIEVVPDQHAVSGSHGVSYQSKTLLPRLSPFDVTLFFDADTCIIGDISPLWPDYDSGEVVLTQMADWVSTGNKMKCRIKPWAETIIDKQTGKLVYQPAQSEIERVKVMLVGPPFATPEQRVFRKSDGKTYWPAINTGVMGWSKNSRAFCDEWHRVTNLRNTFIVDETACQLIFPEFNTRVMDDRFNASVIFPRAGQDVLTRPDVRVLHGHGGKFWKARNLGPCKNRQLYLPHYERFLQSNMGNVRSIPPHPKWFGQLDEETKARLSPYFEREFAAA